MYSYIKEFVFNKKILADIQENKTKRLLKNMNEIQSIGIVFDGSDYDSLMVIYNLERNLKKEGKKVKLFGYINSNESKQEDFLMTKKDLNWFGYPVKRSLYSFTNQPLDVIFGIFDNSKSPLVAIFAKSYAGMRIGTCKEDRYGVFDILISTKERTNKAFANAVIEFITNIKTK